MTEATAPNVEELSARVAARGRVALVERMRKAYRDAASAHADIVSLEDARLEALVQNAADHADGLQWRRALAGLVAEELGVSVAEALSHPAVARAQSILGAPSYEQSLAELITRPIPPPLTTREHNQRETDLPPGPIEGQLELEDQHSGEPQGAWSGQPEPAFRDDTAVEPELPPGPDPSLELPTEVYEIPAQKAPGDAYIQAWSQPEAVTEPHVEPDAMSEPSAEPDLATHEAHMETAAIAEAQVEPVAVAEPSVEPDAISEPSAEPDLATHEAHMETAAMTEPVGSTGPAGTTDAAAITEPPSAEPPMVTQETGPDGGHGASADSSVASGAESSVAGGADSSVASGADSSVAGGADGTGVTGPDGGGVAELRMPAVHLGGVANLPTGNDGLDLRLSGQGLDIMRGSDTIIGRLPWQEIEALEVPAQRRRRRSAKDAARLVVRTRQGDASFDIPGFSSDELRNRVELRIDRYREPNVGG